MGAKVRSRIIALLIAVALIATSGIGVLATDDPSPTGGKVSGGNAYATSLTAGGADWTKVDNAKYYKIYLNGKFETNSTTTHANLKLKKNSHYIVAVSVVYVSGDKEVESEKTELGRLCTWRKVTKTKAKRSGKRAIKVSWKKRTKGIKNYKIVMYKNGKYVKTYTVGKSKSSKKFKKLTKGAKYKFTVYPICTSHFYKGAQQTTKTIKCK